MGNPPAFQLFASDFYMDTVGWSCEEIGVYFRLLMAEWVNGPLPNDPQRLSKICQISAKKFGHNFKNVSPKFVQNEEGFLINLRLEETREKQAQYIESQREKGRIRAEKRWGTKVAAATNGLQPEGQPNHGSSSSIKKKSKKEKFVFVPPDWLPIEEWGQFVEMRNRIKKPMTPYAAHLVVLELGKIKTGQGHDPADVLKQSIKGSWQDVYPLKSNGNGSTGQTVRQFEPGRKYTEHELNDAEKIARGWSYDKAFRRWNMGEIDLPDPDAEWRERCRREAP